ncbi:MAG: chromosomal replication initiator protein DnaA [Marinifilaceae bacterium]
MNSTVIEVWKKCLDILQENIAPKSFKTWFEPIVPEKIEGSSLTLQVPNYYFCEFIEDKFIDELSFAIKTVIGEEASLEYSAVVDSNNTAKSLHVPVTNKYNTSNNPIQAPSVAGRPIKNPFDIAPHKMQIDSQLNPNYTLNNYIEGECNRLARAAGVAIGQNPGKTAFNPLILSGKPGLGKTHLAQAIGVDVKNRFPDKTVLYVSTNMFKTQFVEAVKKNELNDFLHFYQLIDVLILDDIQELAGLEKTQRTFFHIFNHFHQSNKQLILTSDKSPSELKGVEERLISRFKWGLCVDILSPDFNTRLEILRRKAFADGLEIPDNVFEYIAQNINNNIRELEGALISMLAQATLNNKEITLEVAESILGKINKTKKKEYTIDGIQKTICEHFELPVADLQVKTRKREIVQARQIAMYFCKILTRASLASIGSQIGNKDHATVLYACKTVNNLIEIDKNYKAQIDQLRVKLSSSK